MFTPHTAPTLAPLLGLAVLASASALACDQKAPEPAPPKPAAAPAAPAPPVTLSAQIARPAADRVVAIGDLHGDVEAARRALRLAGAIDERDKWVGGKLVVVQTGDLIDRGDGDREVLALVERLVAEAKAAGGEFVSVLGNHEIMNVALDFRYVTEGGFSAFDDAARRPGGARAPAPPDPKRARTEAFSPGGPYALRLAEKPVVAKVGDSVFVHGGVLPKHVAYGLDRMNDELHAWMLGKRPDPPGVVVAEDGPVWTRAYSTPGRAEACAQLIEALDRLGARRMVVGHTVQQGGVTSACNERVWRIDVGLSRFYGGPTQALELTPSGAKVLKQENLERPFCGPGAA